MSLTQLGRYGSLMEANVIKARLESEGISAVVQSDDLGSAAPTLIAASGVRVMVLAEDIAAAQEALERMLPG